MKTIITAYILIIIAFSSCSKNSLPVSISPDYVQSVELHRTKYIDSHKVVKADDKKYFRFFEVNPRYYKVADFKKVTDTVGFLMKTSGKKTPRYFRYGIISFSDGRSKCTLTVYQGEDLRNSVKHADYLFVPYTDLTSGEESYGGGKYMDFVIGDIKDGKLIVDFNKAYNPYCAYTTGYNCPVPPRENHLTVAIKAGEKQFAKE